MHPTSFRPHLNLVGCYVQKGMFDDAMAEAQKAFGLMVRTGPRTRAVLGYIHAAAGRNGEARAILQETSTQSQQFAQPFSQKAPMQRSVKRIRRSSCWRWGFNNGHIRPGSA